MQVDPMPRRQDVWPGSSDGRLAGRMACVPLSQGSHDVLAVIVRGTAIDVLLRRARLNGSVRDVLLSQGPPARSARRSSGPEVAVLARGDGLPAYDFDGLRVEAVRTGRGLGVAVSADHALAAREEADVEELAGEAWIVGTGDGPQFGAWPTLRTPHVAFEARTWQTRLGLVAAGLGVSVLPALAADVLPVGVRWLRVVDPALVQERETVVVTGADRSAGANAMVRAICDLPNER